MFGGPGCGKTARLLEMVGGDPDRVAFVAFTRTAAREARERAADRLNVPAADLKHFRTIHSLCFRELGLGREEVWGEEDWRELMRDEAIPYTGRVSPEEGPALGAEGDELRGVHDHARATLSDPQERLQSAAPHLSPRRLARVVAGLTERKAETGKVEFADMLDEASRLGALPLDLAIVDEAQDLSAAQWAAVDRLLGGAQRFVIGGDDDQAIHAWAGADARRLLRWGGEAEVLSRSYRLPRVVHALVGRIATRIARRVPKRYESTGRPGRIRTEADPNHVDLAEGTWLLLCRNRAFLPLLAAIAADQGVHHSIDGAPAIRGEHARAALNWDRLCAGARLPAEEANLALSYVRGAEALPEGAWTLPPGLSPGPWHERLLGLPRSARARLRAALERGEDVLAPPRVRITTIHGAKGAEADHVLLLNRMTRRTAEGFHVDPDAEHRVWFVGASRARRELVIVDPGLPPRYALPLEGLL